MQVLQGKAEGEGEVLPSLHRTQQGWEGILQRGFPHLAPLLHHSLGRGRLLSYCRPDSEGMEAGSIQRSPFPREGVNKPHAEVQAPQSPPRTPHGPRAPQGSAEPGMGALTTAALGPAAIIL